MLREANVQTLTWADKTMSVLKAQELEACEKRLASLPDFGLFGDCDDARAETLWACSYDAQEHPRATTLHTARSLQAQVLTVLPAEAALLSPMEHSLLERLLILEGEAELMDLGEMSAAESLVRRLWCTVRLLEDNRVLVRLAGRAADAAPARAGREGARRAARPADDVFAEHRGGAVHRRNAPLPRTAGGAAGAGAQGHLRGRSRAGAALSARLLRLYVRRRGADAAAASRPDRPGAADGPLRARHGSVHLPGGRPEARPRWAGFRWSRSCWKR